MHLRRVCVGISGGVDSAVAAFLLKQKGKDVVGVFMKNWDTIDETGGGACTVQKDLTDAEIVCDKLKIPLVRVDFVKHYWNRVFVNLVGDYECGYTPNPDILCNRHIKFKSFYDYCLKELEADAIATGHYANSSFGPYLEKYVDGEDVKLLLPVDRNKDQTFFLSQVEQAPLRRTMFPMALLKKDQVRRIARDRGLFNVADKRDSVGICFVGKRNFQEFISEYIDSKPGVIVDIDTGGKIGDHDGIHQWTLGQRCKIGGKSKAYFVAKKCAETNTIYAALGTEHSSLLTRVVFTNHPHWIGREPGPLTENLVLDCHFRFQHTHPLVKCKAMRTSRGLVILLEESLRAVSPGQYAALYIRDECLGSARISHIGPTQHLLQSDQTLTNTR